MQQTTPTPAETPVVAPALLHGISEDTWGGKFLLGQDLLLSATTTPAAKPAPDQPTPSTRVKGVVKYPLAEHQPPVEAYIISKDLASVG